MHPTQPVYYSPKTTRYLSMHASGMVVCNNSFRRFLSGLYEFDSVIFKKVGPFRKYSVEGVITLKKELLCSRQPEFVQYRNKELQFFPIEEESASSFKRDNQKKVYFGGANPNTPVESICARFSRFGPVSFCKLMEKPASNGTNFGFVIFEERWSADLILSSSQPTIIDGFKLVVNEYSNRGQNRSRKTKFPTPGQAQNQTGEKFPVLKLFDYSDSAHGRPTYTTEEGVFDCFLMESDLFDSHNYNYKKDQQKPSRKIKENVDHLSQESTSFDVDHSIFFRTYCIELNHHPRNIKLNQQKTNSPQTSESQHQMSANQRLNLQEKPVELQVLKFQMFRARLDNFKELNEMNK